MSFIANTKCFLCGSNHFSCIHKGVRGSKDINVIRCESCGLVQLDKFIDDIEKFYEESNMRPVQKTLNEIRATAYRDDYRRYLFTKSMIENRSVLDFGAGAGGFIKLCKECVKDICGIELEKIMQDAIIKEGVPCFSGVKDLKQKMPEKRFNIITLFHVLEHLQNPIRVLRLLADLLDNNGKIIIEVPNADDALLSTFKNDSFADFTYWMCHLYLYSNQTLKALIEKAGLKVKFIQQIQRYPLANHLYWLSHNKPGGHQEWGMLTDYELDKAYEDKIAKLGIADTIIAVVEK